MSTNVVVPGGATLPAVPAHLAAALKALGNNAGVKSGLRGDFNAPPEISTRGKIFRLKVDGEEKPLMRRDQDGEESPVPLLKVVVIGWNQGKYKAFYTKKFSEDAEGEAPACYSFDGVKPSPYAQEPQCKTCAACPKNEWGSVITDDGNKSRACSDNKILAVLPAASVTARSAADTPAGRAYRVKVSPTALGRSKADRKDNPKAAFSLSEYLNLLDNFPASGTTVEVPVGAVETRLFFDTQASYPKLQFKFGGFLSEEDIAYVEMRSKGDDVKLIINDQAPEGAAQREPVEEPKAIAAPKVDPDEGDDGFGAPAPAATTKPAAPAAAAAPAAEPARGRGRPAKAPAAPASAAAAAPKAPEPDNGFSGQDDDTARTDSRMDQELASVADMFA